MIFEARLQTPPVLSSKSTKGSRKGAETGGETELAVPAGEVRLPCHLGRYHYDRGGQLGQEFLYGNMLVMIKIAALLR